MRKESKTWNKILQQQIEHNPMKINEKARREEEEEDHADNCRGEEVRRQRNAQSPMNES